VIQSFAHAGLERFFRSGSKAGIQPKHASRLRVQLTALDSAGAPEDMRAPSWSWRPLKGHYAVSVSGNWRLTFRFVQSWLTTRIITKAFSQSV
jgi:proteic killer suppression protein